MKKIEEYKILSNEEINQNSVYEIILEGNCERMEPGQFVEVKLPGKFLRRPFSIAYQTEKTLHLVYRTIGSGTEQLSHMKQGESLEILTGLGNGFTLEQSNYPLLIGGGTGVAPLYQLACSLIDKGVDPTILLGFKNEKDTIYLDKFLELGEVFISYENHNKYRYVTDYIRKLNNHYDYYYGCGPFPMLKAIANMLPIEGEVSLESRMGCGFGQCKGCSIETVDGMKTICKDGPVFQKKLVKW